MIITGGIFAFLAVAIGAFGAHSLHSILIQNSRIDTFETGVKYQFYHSFAILIVALLYDKYEIQKLKTAFYLFSIGILIFSGSLYVLSLTNILILGVVTPIGGVCFLSAWVFVILSFWKK